MPRIAMMRLDLYARSGVVSISGRMDQESGKEDVQEMPLLHLFPVVVPTKCVAIRERPSAL